MDNNEVSDDEKCMFSDNEQIKTCSTQSSNAAQLKRLTKKRLKTVVSQSKKRNDTLHSRLALLASPQKNKLKFHDACILTYSSKLHVKRHQKKKTAEEPIVKRMRRSSMVEFNWKKHCLFCGKICQFLRDPKNPSRWREAYLCRTTFGDKRQDYKETLLKICDDRRDTWGEEVFIRLNDIGASSDLHAPDARYHEDCRKSFTGKRAKNTSESDKKVVDAPFNRVVVVMRSDTSRTWTSTELFDEYTKVGGILLTRKNLIEKVKKELGSEVVVSAQPTKKLILFLSSNATKRFRLNHINQRE